MHLLLLLLLLLQDEPIRLTPDMLINLAGTKPPVGLVDEPGVTKPKSPWTHGYINRDLHYPVRIVVDLGVPHRLSRISVYDDAGKGRLRVEAGPPPKWSRLFDDPLEGYKRWNRRDVKATARYLLLTFDDPGGLVGELEIHGEPLGPRADAPAPAGAPIRPTMDLFIGLNGFVDDPVDRLAAGGQLREYHSWIWDDGNADRSAPGYPENTFAWNPSGVSGPGWGWNFDDFYRRARDAGIEVVPVVQGRPGWMAGFDMAKLQLKPVAEGEDPGDPAAYAEHADYLFQFAARYGATKVDDALLKLKAGQPRVSGLGLIGAIENWNEPDRTWDGRAGHFRPFELAAMTSADYDGHRGALGKTVGVKNADPRMRFVMAGLAFPEFEYLRAMKFWADVHRGGHFPADVINLHHYSNDAGGQGGKATRGISPEEDDLRGKFAKFAAWRDVHAPGRELWVSEFGYDTHPDSPQAVPEIGPHDRQEVQGQWLVRSFLELAAGGVDRAQMYMLRDVDEASPVKYDTCGLTGSRKSKHAPKKSWFYVAAMRHVLRGTRFAGEVGSGRPNVRVYRFTGGDRTVYAVWCPTSKALTVPGYAPPVDVEGAHRVALAPGEARGVKTDGAAAFTATERPSFVVVPKR